MLIIGWIFILLMYAILLSAVIIFLMDTIEMIVIKIRKRKRKKIIKKLKEMPTWDQVATNLLKYSKKEEKNDRN